MGDGDCFYGVKGDDTNTTYLICPIETDPLTIDSSDFINYTDVDKMWVLLAGFLVFFMQGGFTMLEAGMVKHTNVQNILFKNIMDACIGAISFFLFGYCLAYGDDADSNGFIGVNDVALSSGDYNGFFFQWAFAATAATIVSGSVAERCRLDAYFVYTLALTTWVYPVVVHWMWSGTGWLSPFNENPAVKGGVIDFAGSGVVHMVGGWSGLVGAYYLGPRDQRFEEKKSKVLDRQFKLGHNVAMQAMGTLILWFGWYGFNCGSTLGAQGLMGLASKVAVNTTLAACSGGIAVACLERYVGGIWCVPAICNGVLAALVSVTAPCAVIKPGVAIPIGFIGGMLCYASSKLLERLKIDDPLDAFSVHGACGAWGVISIGIFAYDSDDIAFAGYSDAVVGLSQGHRLGLQVLAVVAIAAWTIVNGLVIFGGLSFFKVLRVDLKTEQLGLDWSEHGGSGYSTQMAYLDEELKVPNVVKEGAKPHHVAAMSSASQVSTLANGVETNGVGHEVEMEKRE